MDLQQAGVKLIFQQIKQIAVVVVTNVLIIQYVHQEDVFVALILPTVMVIVLMVVKLIY